MTAATITTQERVGNYEQRSTYRAKRTDHRYVVEPLSFGSSRDGEHISQSCQPGRAQGRPTAALGQWAWCWLYQAEGTGSDDTASGCGNRQQAEAEAGRKQAPGRARSGLRELQRHIRLVLDGRLPHLAGARCTVDLSEMRPDAADRLHAAEGR